MKKILILSIISGILLTSGVVYSEKVQNGISSEIIRLHVLANSNSPSDQALKLKVRDRILKEGEHLFENASSKAECSRILSENMPFLQAAAEDEILKTINAGTREHTRILLPWNEYPADFREGLRQPINEEITKTYKELIALRHSDKALVYGDFEVLSDKKDRFVYSRTLNGTTYVIDCNLGKKQQKAYLLEGYKAVYLSKNSICHELSPYEARIWCKK